MKDYILELEKKKEEEQRKKEEDSKKQKKWAIIFVIAIIAVSFIVLFLSSRITGGAADVIEETIENKNVELKVYDEVLTKSVNRNNELIYYLYNDILIQSGKKHIHGTGERIKTNLKISDRKKIDSLGVILSNFRRETLADFEEKILGGKRRIRVISQGRYKTQRDKIVELLKTDTMNKFVTKGIQDEQFKHQVKYFNNDDKELALQMTKEFDNLDSTVKFRTQFVNMTVAKGTFEIWIGDSVAIK